MGKRCSSRTDDLNCTLRRALYDEAMAMQATIELDTGAKTFASGLLPQLIDALRRSRPGDLVALTSAEQGIGDELQTWCRFTGNSLVETTVEAGRTRCIAGE